MGILLGVEKGDVVQYGRRICEAVSSLQVPVGDEEEIISLTLSIGFSYFKETDSSYLEVLRRADEAMYKSKFEGKNEVHLLL